ncbi:MAG TPA: 50S ribosomal protein L28 [Clostridiaceae bacterium]|nr:50S ribosomal protein L28 [Clostridiaceae bacterium]
MAKCDVCDKSMFFGKKISITRSQISRRAKVKQKANVKRVRVVVDGTPKTMKVCTKCLKSGAVQRS